MSFFGEIGKELGELVSDAPLGDIRGELEALATQVGEISKELDQARGSVHWTGDAADAFHAHAAQRIKDLHDLVRELDGAAAAAGAVVVAGL